jgi:CYTH domain-containing protein
MAWEIERRFLVRVEDASWLQLGDGAHLRQGYVRNGEPSVRIRTGEERGPVLTCKSGKGVRRTEVETVVPEDVAQALFVAAEDRLIEKIRWKLGPWELDRLLGSLSGLMLLEIELRHEDDPIPDAPPGVHILREVTDDKRFIGGHLARMTEKDRRKFVKKAYKEVRGWTGLSDTH